MHNPEWMCQLCISYKEGNGPVVLACQFHNKMSHGMYIQVPQHPTGIIMTLSSDQYSPCVIVPKTIHKAKAMAYSNMFQMNKMMGHYEGMDLVTLADRGKYNIPLALSNQ